MANLLPGIRGILIIVLIYILMNAAAGIVFLAIFLFGFGDSPGLISTYASGLYDLPENRPALIRDIIDLAAQLILTGIWVYVAWLFLKRKKAATYMFLNAVLAGLLLLAGSMLLGHLLGASREIPHFSGTALIVALGVQQMFDRSPRTKAVFVN